PEPRDQRPGQGDTNSLSERIPGRSLMPAEQQRPPRSASLGSLGRALAHRNYRLYFFGQGISLIGSWMTRVATGWLVFRLAGAESAFLLGITGFAGQMPTFFLAPFAGVLADRWNCHRLLLATQLLSLGQSALLAVVAFHGDFGATTIWQ